MDLAVDLSSRTGRTDAIYRALHAALTTGRVPAGERLPSSRELARDLGVSRASVATAYERLVAEGFLETRTGAGTFAAAAARDAPPPRRGPGALRPRAGWRWAPHPTSGDQPAATHDFHVGIPDAALFPFDTWRRLLAAESRVGGPAAGTYAGPAGLPRFRAAVARYVAGSRGVHAGADDVIATTGTQQAIDLVARVLLEPGDVVAMEDPGYREARELFALHGARVVPVPVDAEGLVVSDIPVDARLIYTTPSHQFPVGMPLSLPRRRALLAHAARHGAAVLEDDYDSEFRRARRPLESLQALDRDGRVIYVGTFSKSLLPGLRAGYLVAPASLRDALLAARQLTDGHGAVHVQAALARFIDDGLLARHVRKASAHYTERHEILLDALAGLPVEPVPSAAGLHVAAYLGPDASLDSSRLVARARRRSVALESLGAYAVGPHRDGIALGFGGAVTSSIRPGIRVLETLLSP
ncbi:PLP-dependent aminotransferase family protein [Myceligenerans pegani]|uniref:PLP-dependent aminotransferase family protein n=1 Tax=Myceligenerans pegani TaxID=2776917 RepID=A0ABR9N3V3_9MICO|nr:PLP-dependent aminotransferase family protein [Myceligenerans sp. TRM 65318]MBE1878338.1 PLP-dependent aminotransferase family protein [Myceligenerans sp. TRM 65318]MBE3020609.1 PLP-dependent aminotransferase family protein [Myceligenerans sp. TRM 65318]